jgi:hypothetical protein
MRVDDQPAAPQLRERHVYNAPGPAIDDVLERRNDIADLVTRSHVDVGRLRNIGRIRELDDDARRLAVGRQPRCARLARVVLGGEVERERALAGDVSAVLPAPQPTTTRTATNASIRVIAGYYARTRSNRLPARNDKASAAEIREVRCDS